MFRGMKGGERLRQELAEVTILLAYLVMSSITSGAFLWIFLHRGRRGES
jgi:hypothetical protein